MSGKLPSMVYSDGIRKSVQVKFGGYNHNAYAGDGDLYDMKNMSSDYYPLLSPRKQRYLYQTLATPNGFYAGDGLFWVDGTGFYADGVKRGTVENSRKQFASLGAYIIILPDLCYYNRLTQEFGTLSAQWTGSAKLQDGTFAGEDANANTIYAAGADWANTFRVGDAVTISGATVHPENNKTIVIREIDGDYLRFYEDSFVIEKNGDTENLGLTRDIPDVQYMCENENRLWACKGDTIYASKLGDPFNWNVFDGISTDSYAVDVGSAGDFTGCCSYLGYPCFFKEEHVYKVYGDKPSNFQVMGSASMGVETGSHASLAIAGEVLFYLSRTGVVAYTGGIPQNIAAPFGTDRYKNAVGGSDGIKYYVSMQDMSGAWTLFVYDTRSNMWHKEDALQVVGFGWNGDLYFLDSTGKLWINGNARTIPATAAVELPVESMVEFGDFTEGDPNKKGTSKLQIRIELDAGATVTVFMQFDSDGQWRDVATLTVTQKRSFYLPIIPRRNDHYKLRLVGKGEYRLYSLARENYVGSEL